MAKVWKLQHPLNFDYDGDLSRDAFRKLSDEFIAVYGLLNELDSRVANEINIGSVAPPEDPVNDFTIWLDTLADVPVLKLYRDDEWMDIIGVRFARLAGRAENSENSDNSDSLGGIPASKHLIFIGGTALALKQENPTLASNEIGFETDTRQSKWGDGATPWAALPYNKSPGGGGGSAEWGDIGGRIADNLELSAALNAKEDAGNKGAPGGYAPLDASGKVPDGFIPDGLEKTADKGKANGYAALDESGKVPARQLPERVELLDSELVQALGSISGEVSIDAADGNIISFTAGGALELRFTASLNTGYCRVLTLIITNGGAQVIVWPQTIDWADQEAPILAEEGKNIVILLSTDGESWIGMMSGGNFA